MRRSPTALLLASALLASSLLPLALAQEGKHRGTTPPMGETAQGEHGDPRGAQRGGQRPAVTGAFTFSTSNQQVSGTFVDFHYNDSGLQGFAVAGNALFDATVGGRGNEEGERGGVEAHGAEVRLRTASFELRVHDNPEAVTQILTNGGITLVLASGVSARTAGDGTVKFTAGNVSGSIRGQSLALAGNTVTSTDRLLVFVNAPHGNFDVYRSDIHKGVASGHVGVEASYNKPGKDVEQDVVSYGNVTMQTIKAERGNLTLQVEGHGFDGRVLVLNVDGRVVGASRADDLNILFDNASISRADNITDVLDPDDDGLRAEYYIVFDPAQEVFQVLVSVPHYSVHTLSVTTAFVLPPPSVIVGIVGGALLLVPSAFLLFRRKR